MDFDFYAYVQEQMREVFEESDRAFVEYATKLGYVKQIRCKDCGSFIPMLEDVSDKEPGFCRYFKTDVPCEHYCSYAWKDEDE